MRTIAPMLAMLVLTGRVTSSIAEPSTTVPDTPRVYMAIEKQQDSLMTVECDHGQRVDERWVTSCRGSQVIFERDKTTHRCSVSMLHSFVFDIEQISADAWRFVQVDSGLCRSTLIIELIREKAPRYPFWRYRQTRITPKTSGDLCDGLVGTNVSDFSIHHSRRLACNGLDFGTVLEAP